MSKKIKKNPPFFLDRFSVREARIWEQRYQFIADYYWDHYCYFANQRSLILNELKAALTTHCCPFVFSQWQRVVNYKFTLEPLSAKGSVLNYPGGRFNIGDIDSLKFPRFPSLYLAADRDTAYKEKFSLDQKKRYHGLTAEDLSLTSNKSITVVTLNGQIAQVINLSDSTTLKEFFNLIKNIKLPPEFVKRANKLNIKPMFHVQTIKELLKSLLYPNWREIPMMFDIPANSQIFGQIAHAAGIEGILYPSKITGKNCLALFPENFAQSMSFVEIVDEVPEEVKCGRLDEETYLQCV